MSAPELAWMESAACADKDPAIFCPPKLPTKHEFQREKERAERELRKRARTGDNLQADERAELDKMHAEQRDRWIRARIICWSCPVRRECLTYALANEPDEHFWGGMSGIERRVLRNHRRETTAKVAAAMATAVEHGIAS